MVISAGILRGFNHILMLTTQRLIHQTGFHTQHVLPVVLLQARLQSAAQAISTNLQSEASAFHHPTPLRQLNS